MTGSLSSMSSDQSVGVTSSLSSIHPLDACPNIHGFELRIDSTHNFEEFTLYEVRVTYRYASWKVRRRYREFAELHSELSRVYPGNQMRGHAFPGKRMLGNFSKKFVEKRRKKLEEYLRNVFQALKTIPKPLAYFLDMQKYELNWILHTLSESIYNRTQYNESLQLHIQRSRNFQLDTLQLHAIHQRMSLQLLPDACEMTEATVNLAHLMDFAFNLRVLKVEGRRHRAGTSDWQLNEVCFSLAYFKSLKHLQFECVNMEMIEESSFDMLIQHLVNLHCHKSVSTCSGILNPTRLPNPPQWNSLIRINLSKNNLTSIDESICLAPKLQFLDLSYNHLNCIQNLSTLCSLRELNLSHNNFSYLEDLNTKLGNIKRLFLDHNKLFSLDGLAKLYSIEKLSCNANRLCELHDINAVSGMPCLESLSLKENPLCSILDYRTKVLEIFQDRAPEVILDGLITTGRELDTVRVLVALSKARKSSRGLTRAHTFSGVPTFDSDHETPHGAVCSLRSSENRTFTRMEVREIMENEQRDVSEQRFDSDKRQLDAKFVPCPSLKLVKSGLVLGLTGEVSMIDWNTIIENPAEESNSYSAPLLLQSSISDTGISGAPGSNLDEATGSKDTVSESDALRNLASFLSSNVSSRTECTRLFSFIIKQEENKDESLTQTQSFLQLIKQFVLSSAADLIRSSWHDPFALSASGTTQNTSAAAAAVAVAEEEESYPSYVLWEQVTRSNKSAITTLPLSNGFRALASCDCRKFVTIFHDQLICVPQEKERLRFSMWCYLQLKKSMSFPKQAVVFVSNLKVYIYFDSSGGCMLNTLEDNANDKMTRVANKNRRRVVQLSSKRRSLLNGHGLVMPPIEELADNLYLVLDIPITQFINVQLSTTGQCASVVFHGQNHTDMLVGTMDCVDLQAFCEQIKHASVTCPLNLFELRDFIFTTQSDGTYNMASADSPEQIQRSLTESAAKSNQKVPGRIFFASNLMRLKVNEEIQSTFPILVLSESFLCFCKDPLVVGEVDDEIDDCQNKEKKQDLVKPLVTNSGSTLEVCLSETTSGDVTAAVGHFSTKREPECSSSKDIKSASVRNASILAMHKISNILILKLAEGSNNICLSVRTLVHSIDELSDSLELNLQEDYYDDTDESKQNGNLPICYIEFSFRLTKDKERFAFLLQKRFEDVARKRIAIITS